jgi:hypothetical protein
VETNAGGTLKGQADRSTRNLVGHRQARKGFPVRRPVRRNAQQVEHHHELAHVLARIPVVRSKYSRSITSPQ